MSENEFNGYNFDNHKSRKKMKYLIVLDGDLDLNGAYAFKSKKDLIQHLKEDFRKVYAVFKVEDITNDFN